jgi:hypothetical protein
MSVRRVAVHLGPGDQLTERYILAFLCDRWRAAGIQLVLLDDPGRVVEADLAIVHVDATRRPADYDALQGRYSRVINGGVQDISKRRISSHLLSQDSTYSDPVIVKTDANWFDMPDASRDIRRRRSYPIYETPVRVRRRPCRGARIIVLTEELATELTAT